MNTHTVITYDKLHKPVYWHTNMFAVGSAPTRDTQVMSMYTNMYTIVHASMVSPGVYPKGMEL